MGSTSLRLCAFLVSLADARSSGALKLHVEIACPYKGFRVLAIFFTTPPPESSSPLGHN